MNQILNKILAYLIVAADLDTEFALPGIGEIPRKPQLPVITRGQRLVSTMRHPEILILQSKWLTQGWTYQEAVLFARRLVSISILTQQSHQTILMLLVRCFCHWTVKGEYELRPYFAEQMWCTTGFNLSPARVGDTHREGEEGRSMILSPFLPTLAPEL